MLSRCFDLMRQNILIWISLILNIFNYFSLTVKRILTPTFFFLSLEYFFWDIWGEPQQFLVRATFYPFSRPSQLGILVLRLLCVLKFTILEDKTIFKKSGHVRAWNMDGIKSIVKITLCWNLQTHENDVKLYLGKTQISSASVMANHHDNKI